MGLRPELRWGQKAPDPYVINMGIRPPLMLGRAIKQQ